MKKYILNYLILKIQAEDYSFNGKLPSIRFIANKFKVKTKLVQEIYNELRNSNLIRSVPKVGYICNEDYIYNLWRTRNDYVEVCGVYMEKAPEELLDNLNLKGEYFLRYLQQFDNEKEDQKNRKWVSLIKFNFLFEKKDITIPVKKLFNAYGKAITEVKISMRGLSAHDSKNFEQCFALKSDSVIEEKVRFYSFNEFVAEINYYQPNTIFAKKIDWKII